MGKKIKNKSTQQQQQTLQNNNEIKKLERQKKLKIKKLLNKSKDYSSNEEIKFSEELLKEGYLIEYIETDGNCLFRSISDQLYNNQNKHYEIRNIIMNYIEENEEHFKLFIEDDESFEDYLSRMR